MKKINFIFALLLSLMGVTQMRAEAVIESFEDVTAVDADSWGRAGKFSNGWVCISSSGSMYSTGIGSSTDYNYSIWSTSANTGSKSLAGISSSSNSYYIVNPTEVSGEVSFYITCTSTSSRTTGNVRVYKGTDNGDGTFTIGSQIESYDVTGSSSYPWVQKTINLVESTILIFKMYRAALDDFTYEVAADGPAVALFSPENKKMADGDTYDFGLVKTETSKTFVIKNTGTEDVEISFHGEGGFDSYPTANTTIPVGESLNWVVTLPTDNLGQRTGKIGFILNGVDTSINLTGTVLDPNKMFEDFSAKALPSDWTSTGSWNFADGYAKTGNNTNLQLTTPVMVFEDGETFIFEAAGCSTWASYGAAYQGKVIVQTSTDGTNFSDLQTFSGMGLDEWQSCSVTIPAGTKYVRFVASYASIDNVYGGELDQTPRPKLEVEGIANGGSLSWGYSDVPAGSTKTITLKNDGTADLDVTMAATDDYTVDPASATIEAGSSVVVTIGTPAHDGSGTLTITPAEESGLSPYTISLSSYYKEPKPAMSIDKTSIAFGKVNEVKSETITVSNTGDADLVATITNDNTENFTVEPAESLTVAPGETGTITVTYNYAEGTWGTFNANVKVTPNYGTTYDAKTITVSASSKDPNVWDEDFESGELDQDWISNGWTISTPGSYGGGNGTKMAGGNSTTATLITPRLIATEGQTLTFELGGAGSSYPLTVEYSTDRDTWTEIASFTEDGTCTIEAPVTDPATFYLRFTGWVYIDNLNGFKLDKPAHDATITAVTIPATGNQYVEYTASITLKELVGKDENVNIKFYLGENQVGETVESTIDPNGEETYEVTFTPEEAFEGEAHFVVTFVSDDDEVFATFNSDPVAVTIAAAPVLDETTGSLEGFENWTNYPVVSMKYSLKAGWNTIILPFAWSDLSVFGEGAKVYAFSDYSDANGISFTAATSLNAQTPYVLYATEAKSEITFMGVTQFRTSTEADNLQVSKSGATFQGTYAPVAAPDMEGKYGVVPSTGRIQKGSEKASMKGFRGYFTLPASAPANVVATFFDADGTVTAIKDVRVLNAENGDIFDLSGRKVTGKAKAGVYIQNGKKIVVK